MNKKISAIEAVMRRMEYDVWELKALIGYEPTDNHHAENTLSLAGDKNRFIGKKPVAVVFIDEQVEAKSWRKVAGVILKRCLDERGDRLLNLRNKVQGRVRTIFADRPDGMLAPLKIAEDAYFESHYGTACLLDILCRLILDYTGFDYSNIRIVIKSE